MHSSRLQGAGALLQVISIECSLYLISAEMRSQYKPAPFLF